MSVFFTDTDCELWYTDVDKYDIKVIKMPYTLDDVEYFYDMGRETDFDKLFNRMKQGSMPSTSALNPNDYYEYFEPYFKSGEDILYVHFSDQMSGTFKYLQMALNDLQEKYKNTKFTMFNTKSICWGAGLQALEAAKMHHAGKSDEEIIEFLNDFTKHVAVYFTVDSLSHLRRGGRISALSATFGTMLNIKPILHVNDEGRIEKYGTGKGMKKAILEIVEFMKENYLPGYPIYLLDAMNKPDIELFEKEIKKALGEDVVVENYPIGPVIGAHCGPGTVGAIFYSKKR